MLNQNTNTNENLLIIKHWGKGQKHSMIPNISRAISQKFRNYTYNQIEISMTYKYIIPRNKVKKKESK